MARLVDSDVLVLGSGGAGLRAAVEISEAGCRVSVVSKSPSGMNNATVVSGGGFHAAIEGVTIKEHLKETVDVGKNLNDPALVKIFAKEGGERVLELQKYGVKIRIKNGGANIGEIPTLLGLALTKPMIEYAKGVGVEFLDNIIVTKLLKVENRVVGAVGYDIHGEEPVVFQFKAVIIATGGAGAIYRRTDCPVRTTGDGYSLGLHAGAKLRDMEFVQFYPMALAEPGIPPYLLGETITEEGKIMNVLGDDIPSKYSLADHPLVLKSRDLLSRAVMLEIRQGEGIDGSVLLDARSVFKNRSIDYITEGGTSRFLVEKLKATEKPFRVAPICHYCMGGIIIDINGHTGVPGLYAAGEVVGGVHGANRQGGNALTDILVFGKRAGSSAASYALKHNTVDLDELAKPEIKRYNAILSRDHGYDGYAIIEKLKDVMWEKVGVIRDAISLADAFEEVYDLKLMADHVTVSNSRDMLQALEASMSLESAELIIRGAMERRESRGAHYRTDYPNEDSKLVKPVIQIYSDTGAIKVQE